MYDEGIEVAGQSMIIFYKMKIKYILPAVILLAVVLIWGCSNTRKIKSDPPLDSTAVRNLLDSQSFVFIAVYVNPMGGRRRDLNSGYELSISKDSLISYLPFFGRGYSSPISPSDVDFDYKSTNFTYTVMAARRGWNITIKPKDQNYLQELYFRVFDNGSTSLNVTSINRSSISYDGYITRRKTYGGKSK